MAEYVPEINWFLEYVPEYHIRANGLVGSQKFPNLCVSKVNWGGSDDLGHLPKLWTFFLLSSLLEHDKKNVQDLGTCPK